LVGVLLLVGFLVLRWAALSEAQAQAQVEEQRRAADEARVRAEEAKQLADKLQAAKEELRRAQAENAAKGVAPLAQRHFLEKGKSYTFSWQDTIGPAVVLEELRDNWVRVRMNDLNTWINLNTVHRVTAAPQDREKKDADRGAVGDKGTVQGVVTFLGKPVPKGKVTFHPEKGNPVEADLDENGSFMAKGVPVGSFGVTVKAEGLPEKYAVKDTTPLKFVVMTGVNEVHIVLNR
jgi:hypothetical protein